MGRPPHRRGALVAPSGGHYLEWHSFPIHEYTLEPPVVRDGKVWPEDGPGTGVRFDWEKLAPYLEAGSGL